MPPRHRKLPEGWMKFERGYWRAEADLAIRYLGDGEADVLGAGTVFSFDRVEDVSGFRPSPTRVANRVANRMFGRGSHGDRNFEFSEPVEACFNPRFGDGGYHYLRPRGLISPLAFPDYLPPGVTLPDFWTPDGATDESIGESDIGHGFGLFRGRRELLTFPIDGCAGYDAFVSINARGLNVASYYDREDRTELAAFLDDAESLIVTFWPVEAYPLPGRSSCAIEVDRLPREWLAQMLHQERLGVDADYKAADDLRKVDEVKTLAADRFGSLTVEEAFAVIAAGGQLRIGTYCRQVQSIPTVTTYYVLRSDVEEQPCFSEDHAVPDFVAGILDSALAVPMVSEAYRHAHGLSVESELRTPWPGRADAFVHRSSPAASATPRVRSDNVIFWNAALTGESLGGAYHHWTGRSFLGGFWRLQLGFDTRYDFWRIDMERSLENGDSRPGCRPMAGTAAYSFDGPVNVRSLPEAFEVADGIARTEEVLHLLKRGVSMSDLSTDLLRLLTLHDRAMRADYGDWPYDDPRNEKTAAAETEIRRRQDTIPCGHWDAEGDRLHAIKAAVEETLPTRSGRK